MGSFLASQGEQMSVRPASAGHGRVKSGFDRHYCTALARSTDLPLRAVIRGDQLPGSAIVALSFIAWADRPTKSAQESTRDEACGVSRGLVVSTRTTTAI